MEEGGQSLDEKLEVEQRVGEGGQPADVEQPVGEGGQPADVEQPVQKLRNTPPPQDQRYAPPPLSQPLPTTDDKCKSCCVSIM